MSSVERGTIADAMHAGVLSCEADATLADVARMMVTHHVTHLVVIDPKSQRPLGILSSLDLAALVASGKA
jgi:CBS domain-containing protein